MEQVIFSANADSLDSWDMENLKYLRKLSIRNPNCNKHDTDTISYRSDSECFVNECEELLESGSGIFQPSKGNGSEFVRKIVKNHEFPLSKKDSIIAVSSKLKKQKQVLLVDENNNNNNEEIPIMMMETISSREGSNKSNRRVIVPQQMKKLKPLDDCYIMDVLMIRNESVLTDDKSFVTSKGLVDAEEPILIHSKAVIDNDGLDSLSRKEINLLRGCASSPSSVSSDDSFTSAIAKGFFDMDNNNRCSILNRNVDVKAKRHLSHILESPTNIPPSSMLNYTRVDRTIKPMAEECPFCGGCGRSDSFIVSKNQQSKLVKSASLAGTVGGESPPINMPKTPSPYYIRLTKDLLKSNCSPLLGSLKKPHNYGLNTSGHLVIDYSSNWKNLESYVKSLSSSTSNLTVKRSTKIPERLRTRYST